MAEHDLPSRARDQWRAAEEAGVYHGTDEDTADGCIFDRRAGGRKRA